MLIIYALVLSSALPGCLSEKFHFFNGGESLGVTFETDLKRRELRCYITAPVSSRREAVSEVSNDELKRLKKDCKRFLPTQSSVSRDERALIKLIAPGTKWCGSGNTANNDNDLGSKPVTDACCRAHDKCKPKIKGFGRIGSFINVIPWTRLHCDCDQVFYNCLKQARKTSSETSIADLVGISYFNILDTHCFKEHSYKICTKIGWFKCKKYTTYKSYKWKDNKSY